MLIRKNLYELKTLIKKKYGLDFKSTSNTNISFININYAININSTIFYSVFSIYIHDIYIVDIYMKLFM